MHQRTRERLPRLPRLVDTAESWKNDQAALLHASSRTEPGTVFEHAGTRYRRVGTGSRPAAPNHRPSHLVVEDAATGARTDVTITEDEAFWAWAVIETLRHTGVRIEELLELTHFALVSHRMPDTGELVPLLQIVPSKSDEERLLLVTPELASVLAAVISRIRTPDGTIPLAGRYDSHERVTSPALPHLFQHPDGFMHKNGWRNDVLGTNTVRHLLNRAITRTGLTDAAGQPLHYTPHDFRRMFATEAVTGGLPVHIAAKILGHASVNTTQAYTAVFQDQLIRTYRAFVDERRALRPGEEYRDPTDDEWAEFQQHFHLRKLELGDCGRPYGTPCIHEHVPLTELTGRLPALLPRATDRGSVGWSGPWRRSAATPCDRVDLLSSRVVDYGDSRRYGCRNAARRSEMLHRWRLRGLAGLRRPLIHCCRSALWMARASRCPRSPSFCVTCSPTTPARRRCGPMPTSC
ncbi:tyrosine-type recombinase/integrase [Frankia torreyi]|nr:tyrosine-type recombinase/integrase [Frankia torreyi]